MKVRISSVPLVLDWIAEKGASAGSEEAVRRILDHPDYRFEIRRYGLASIEHLISYFSGLRRIEPARIPELCDGCREALREKHSLWLDCADDPGKYRERYEKLKDILCGENVKRLQEKLRGAFPETAAMEGIEDAQVISTLSFGPSFGYVYENALHLDLFGIGKYCTWEELPYVILHEMHHLQVQKLMGGYGSFTEKFSPAEEYIFRFTGEGLAVKFCNNARGVISKKIDADLPANIGLPAMSILNGHFEEAFRLFNDTLKGLLAGTVTEEEMNRQFADYWWNPYLYQEEAEFLAQTPIYSFGNELFGCIYDAFGMETLFACFYHPKKTIEAFNRTNCGYTILG